MLLWNAIFAKLMLQQFSQFATKMEVCIINKAIIIIRE